MRKDSTLANSNPRRRCKEPSSTGRHSSTLPVQLARLILLCLLAFTVVWALPGWGYLLGLDRKPWASSPSEVHIDPKETFALEALLGLPAGGKWRVPASSLWIEQRVMSRVAGDRWLAEYRDSGPAERNAAEEQDLQDLLMAFGAGEPAVLELLASPRSATAGAVPSGRWAFRVGDGDHESRARWLFTTKESTEVIGFEFALTQPEEDDRPPAPSTVSPRLPIPAEWIQLMHYEHPDRDEPACYLYASQTGWIRPDDLRSVGTNVKLEDLASRRYRATYAARRYTLWQHGDYAVLVPNAFSASRTSANN